MCTHGDDNAVDNTAHKAALDGHLEAGTGHAHRAVRPRVTAHIIEECHLCQVVSTVLYR